MLELYEISHGEDVDPMVMVAAARPTRGTRQFRAGGIFRPLNGSMNAYRVDTPRKDQHLIDQNDVDPRPILPANLHIGEQWEPGYGLPEHNLEDNYSSRPGMPATVGEVTVSHIKPEVKFPAIELTDKQGQMALMWAKREYEVAESQQPQLIFSSQWPLVVAVQTTQAY